MIQTALKYLSNLMLTTATAATTTTATTAPGTTNFNPTTDYVIGGAIIAVIAVLILVASIRVYKNCNAIRLEEKSREVEGVILKRGVRYTKKATIVDKQGNDMVSFVKHDIIIKPRKTVKVSRNNDLKPGKWTVLASNEDETSFNIRVSGYVREYKHGQEIILAEGDEVCPTSTTIILR